MSWFKALREAKRIGHALGEDWDVVVNRVVLAAGQRYQPVDPTGELPESLLLSRLGLWAGQDGLGPVRYGSTFYVQKPDGISVKCITPWGDEVRTTACGGFIEDVVINAFLNFGMQKASGGSLSWTWANHNAFMITNPQEPFSPVLTLVEAGYADDIGGIGEILDGDYLVGQGWNADYTSGHTFLIVRQGRTEVMQGEAWPPLLILEANRRQDQDGPGWWGIGDLHVYPNLESLADWWARPTVPTYETLLAQYPNTRFCRLRVQPYR